MESKLAISKRLHAEGRWEEACQLMDDIRAQLREQGSTKKEANSQAWQAISERFPLPVGEELLVLPIADVAEDPVIPDAVDETAEFVHDDATYCDTLDWVSNALGLIAQGRKLQPADSPNAAAWGLLTWAVKAPRDFWSAWIATGRKQAERQREEQVEARRQEEELLEMLEELRAEVTQVTG
ncbi:MAG: hypothetical protein ACYC3X_04540 [Pirellulaceae bacterium]